MNVCWTRQFWQDQLSIYFVWGCPKSPQTADMGKKKNWAVVLTSVILFKTEISHHQRCLAAAYFPCLLRTHAKFLQWAFLLAFITIIFFLGKVTLQPHIILESKQIIKKSPCTVGFLSMFFLAFFRFVAFLSKHSMMLLWSFYGVFFPISSSLGPENACYKCWIINVYVKEHL